MEDEQPPSDPYPIPPPVIQRTKGHPKGSENKRRGVPESSTRRDLSAFERSEQFIAKENEWCNCGWCQQAAAHNKRNCPERLKAPFSLSGQFRLPALPKKRETAATSTPTPTLPFTAHQLATIASAVEFSMHQQKLSTQMMS
ncbi:hypothetical protein PsorP6_013649 [Peronosclerospora sorghi]|uniref:Uncharacterized protein n=1 Tax=Peronosclerospora sorghi TaxID=230839 RepID=A0ACC0VGK6_9STRA|nr:hypothetical protein PsorP6_013649 [Peronosclerospora sorghi]